MLGIFPHIPFDIYYLLFIIIEVKYFSTQDYLLKRSLRINNYVNMKLFRNISKKCAEK